MKLKVGIDLEAAGKEIAAGIRALLARERVLALNLIGSPGSGKTALLEATVPELAKTYAVTVIEGDIATSRDADRIRALGVPCHLINTGGTCHLPPRLIAQALQEVDLASTDVLFIENVGNLVCPSTQDVGEDAKVALLSLPEGDDKVLKYPRLFREASCVVLNKVDLAGVLPFRREQLFADLAQIKDGLPVFELSARTGVGCAAFVDWVRGLYEKKVPAVRSATSEEPSAPPMRSPTSEEPSAPPIRKRRRKK
jgi:hydrogenase nickel incorporation protein HypB